MDVRFTAGEFAKLCGIPKQTLLFYDKENVIHPKYKDPYNGYRYYAAEQLEQLDTILILREMGLSLEEIRAHMSNRTLEQSMEMLESQRRAIQEKIARLTTIQHRIDLKMKSLKLFQDQDPSFQIRTLPEALLAAVSVKEPAGLLQVDLALKGLMKQVKRMGAGHFYQVGDVVARESLERGEFLRFKWAFLPLDAEDEGIFMLRKPAGAYAVQCHVGAYETMGETYRAMLEEIGRRGRTVAGDAYEFCILDSLTSSSPDQYCTQLHIPLK